MSIIITGLEMPTERESYNLTIKYNGVVLDTETGMQVAGAYELLPHGRLIDADALVKCLAILLQFPSNLVNGQWIVNTLREQPTIIPASKEEIMYYPQIPGITPTVIKPPKEGEE